VNASNLFLIDTTQVCYYYLLVDQGRIHGEFGKVSHRCKSAIQCIRKLVLQLERCDGSDFQSLTASSESGEEVGCGYR
jgi:hypothetical protein